MWRITKLNTLGFRLVLTIVASVMIGGAGLLLIFSGFLRGELTTVTSTQMSTMATYVAHGVDRDIAIRREILEKMARNIGLEWNGEGVPPFSTHRFASASAFFPSGVLIFDTLGRRLAAIPNQLSVDRDGFVPPDLLVDAEHGFALGRPVESSSLKIVMQAMAVPIQDWEGLTLGFLVGITSFRSANFLGALYDTRVGRTGGFLLVSPRDRVVLAGSDDVHTLRPVREENAHPQHVLALKGVYGVGMGMGPEGVDELAATAPVPNAGWFVVARIPTNELLEPLHRLAVVVLVYGGLVVVAVTCLGLFLLKMLMLPLQRSAALANQMSRGDMPLMPLPVVRDDEVGRLTGAYNNLLSSLLASRDEFRRLAQCDGMTGLANRIHFDQAFQRTLSRARRHDSHLAVLFFDLDDFKPINDDYGHEAGDAVLKVVAERLCNEIRPEDLPARIGGDEFAVLLGDLTDAQTEAHTVAERCRRAIARPIPFGGRLLMVGVSVGVACYPEDSETPAGLLAAADHAMYLDKAGRTATLRLAAQ